MTVIQKTIQVPEDHRITLDIPKDIQVGDIAVVTISVSEKPESALSDDAVFDPTLAGLVNPAAFRKGKITGDIIGPFYEEWEESE